MSTFEWGKIPSSKWTDVGTAFVWGTSHPRGFIGSLRGGKIPSSGRMDGWTSMSALTLSYWGTSSLRVYRHDSPSGGTSQQRRIACQPQSGGNPITGVNECQNCLHVGHTPSTGGLLAISE